MANNKALLNRRKGTVRQLHEKINKSSNVEEMRNLCRKLVEVVDQITGRAEAAEDRIVELETWSPQTVDFECPQCSNEIQFSMPGSNWYRKQMEIMSRGQEQTKSSSRH